MSEPHTEMVLFGRETGSKAAPVPMTKVIKTEPGVQVKVEPEVKIERDSTVSLLSSPPIAAPT